MKLTPCYPQWFENFISFTCKKRDTTCKILFCIFTSPISLSLMYLAIITDSVFSYPRKLLFYAICRFMITKGKIRLTRSSSIIYVFILKSFALLYLFHFTRTVLNAVILLCSENIWIFFCSSCEVYFNSFQCGYYLIF